MGLGETGCVRGVWGECLDRGRKWSGIGVVDLLPGLEAGLGIRIGGA